MANPAVTRVQNLSLNSNSRLPFLLLPVTRSFLHMERSTYIYFFSVNVKIVASRV